MALITTPGAANADSFATVAEFKVYRDSRFPQVAAVLAASDSVIEAALIVSARALGASFTWTGAAVDAIQALTWPRSGMLTRNGFPIATSGAASITAPLKDAQCEWAYQFLAGVDTTSDSDALRQGVSSVKAGSVAVSFQSIDTSNSEAMDALVRRFNSDFDYLNAPGEVRRLLVPSWYKQPGFKRPALFKVLP